MLEDQSNYVDENAAKNLTDSTDVYNAAFSQHGQFELNRQFSFNFNDLSNINVDSTEFELNDVMLHDLLLNNATAVSESIREKTAVFEPVPLKENVGLKNQSKPGDVLLNSIAQSNLSNENYLFDQDFVNNFEINLNNIDNDSSLQQDCNFFFFFLERNY